MRIGRQGILNGRFGVLRQFLHVSLFLCAGIFGLVRGAEGSTIILDDFEGGFDAMTGGLSGTSPVNVTPKRGMRSGMRIDVAGQRGCDNLIGDSFALCGADTLKWGGTAGTVLSYAVDFGAIARILFDIAAFSDSDPFDPYSGDNSNLWGDYVRVSGVTGGTRTLLAEFTGFSRPERTKENAHFLVSTDAGAGLGAGVVADATFDRVVLRLGGLLDGWGRIDFEIRTTGSAEQVGLDNIRLAPVPLPGALSLTLVGLGALGAFRRPGPRRG